jgi:hypothetical protein
MVDISIYMQEFKDKREILKANQLEYYERL